MKRFKCMLLALVLCFVSLGEVWAADTTLYGPISCMSYYRIWSVGVLDDYSMVIWHGMPTSSSVDGWYVNGFDGAAVTTVPTLIVSTAHLEELGGEEIGGWMVSRFQRNSDGTYSVHGWEYTMQHVLPYWTELWANFKWRMDISAEGTHLGFALWNSTTLLYDNFKTVQIGTDTYNIYENQGTQTVSRYNYNRTVNYGAIATSANNPYVVPNTTPGSLTYILYYLQNNVMYGKYMEMDN